MVKAGRKGREPLALAAVAPQAGSGGSADLSAPPRAVSRSKADGKRPMPRSELLPLALISTMNDLSKRQAQLRVQLFRATELFNSVKSDLERLHKRSQNHQEQVAELQSRTRQRLEEAAQKMSRVVHASRSEAPEICAEWLTLIKRRPGLMTDPDGRAELERFLQALKADVGSAERHGRHPSCPPKLLRAIESFIHEADRLPRRCQARVELLSRRVDITSQFASRSADASLKAERAFDEASKLEVGVRQAEMRVQECILDLILLARLQQRSRH